MTGLIAVVRRKRRLRRLRRLRGMVVNGLRVVGSHVGREGGVGGQGMVQGNVTDVGN